MTEAAAAAVLPALLLLWVAAGVRILGLRSGLQQLLAAVRVCCHGLRCCLHAAALAASMSGGEWLYRVRLLAVSRLLLTVMTRN